MNVWGAGSFDNDAASAFITEVTEDGAFALQEAFEVILDPDTDFVAEEEGARAVAAAELLSAHLSGDTSAVDAPGRHWLSGLAAGELAFMRLLAREALSRVLGPNSEWQEYWAYGESREAWLGTVRRLQSALD